MLSKEASFFPYGRLVCLKKGDKLKTHTWAKKCLAKSKGGPTERVPCKIVTF